MNPNDHTQFRSNASRNAVFSQAFDTGPHPAQRNLYFVIALASMPLVALVVAVSAFAYWLAG